MDEAFKRIANAWEALMERGVYYAWLALVTPSGEWD